MDQFSLMYKQKLVQASNKLKLFIDDERYPVDNSFRVVRTSKEAMNFVKTNGMPDFISFDHDLGGSDTAMVFVNWLIDYDLDHDVIKKYFAFYVHSQNPIGKKNIEGTINGYLRFKFNN